MPLRSLRLKIINALKYATYSVCLVDINDTLHGQLLSPPPTEISQLKTRYFTVLYIASVILIDHTISRFYVSHAYTSYFCRARTVREIGLILTLNNPNDNTSRNNIHTLSSMKDKIMSVS